MLTAYLIGYAVSVLLYGFLMGNGPHKDAPASGILASFICSLIWPIFWAYGIGVALGHIYSARHQEKPDSQDPAPGNS